MSGDPLRRFEGARELIEQRAYFVLRAPRQVGKTASLLALADALTAEGRHAGVLVSCERGGPSRTIRALLSSSDRPLHRRDRRAHG
jgi:hypothetical protein